MTNKATFIKDVSERFRGVAELWHLDPPLAEDRFYYSEDREDETVHHQYVIVSAISDLYECETYIFPATEDGEIESWLELDGSYKGGTDIDLALRRAGYEELVRA